MGKAEKSEKTNKKQKHFWKDFKAELKKVIWPTPKQVANNTTAVITIVLITAIIVFVLDVAFEKVNTHGIDRLRSVVSSKETNNISNEIDSNVVGNTIENNMVETNTIQDNNTISE